MRDVDRMKERLELSLDSRHVVGIVVGAIVVLGGVFSLGVMVGKKGAPAPAAVQGTSRDLLAALDERAVAPAEGVDASLTFDRELMKPVEAPAVAVAAPPAPSVPTPAPLPPPPAPAPSLPESPATKEATPTATRVHVDAGGAALKEAFARAMKPSDSGPIPPTGTWCVQLSAHPERAEAEKFAQVLREKGYAPYIVASEIAGKGTWHRVRLGRFADREAASKYLSDFKRETRLEAFVTNAR